METFESHAAKVSSACNVIRSTVERLKQVRLANPGAILANKGVDAEHAMDIDVQLDPDLLLDVEEIAAQGEATVQNLRLLNRNVQHEERMLRNALTELKASVGQVDLGLQNLRYQRKYLLNEIARCHDFETYYQDVDLVPIGEFRATAPPTLSDTTDDHQLMLNRLQFELDERKRFDLEKRKLLAIKTQLVKANKTQKAHIAKVEKHLEDYITASVPIQELFFNNPTGTGSATSTTLHDRKNLDSTKLSTVTNHASPSSQSNDHNALESAPMRVATTNLMKRNDLAQLLPEPLYVLYRHATAFSSTFGDEVRAEVHDLRGTQMDIKMEDGSNKVKGDTEPTGTKSKPTEDEEAAGQHNRRGSSDRTERMYERAPFDVVIKIKKDATPTSNTIMHLRFGYLVRLGIVVVKVEGAPGILKLDCSQILHELFPRDFGEVCPNPEVAFLGLDAFGALVSNDERSGEPGSDMVLNIQEAGGYAYRWAQEICGLEYLGPYSQGWGLANGTNGSRAGRRAFLGQIVRLIRSRRRAWKALERQIEDLDRGTISQPRLSISTTDMSQDGESVQTLFATLKEGLSKSNLILRGWHAVEDHDVRHALVYRVYFEQKTAKNTRLSSNSGNAAPTPNTFAEGTVEIYLAYPDHLPQWEIKPGPAFPEEPVVDKPASKSTVSSDQHLSVDSPDVPSNDASPRQMDDEGTNNARGEAMEDVAMDDDDARTGAGVTRVSPLEQLRILQASVNNDMAGTLQNADPYEHNLLISAQVAKIQLGLDAILDESSSRQ
ncbi:THO complex subunit 5 [Actinomortierella wolfii]|nr:THO complex subunit 5 [Actinomortierella wolfii]